MNLVTLTMVAAGITLLYSGIKGFDPRAVIKDALAGKSKPGDAFALPESDPYLSNPLIPGGNANNFFDLKPSQQMPEEDTGSARV